MFCFYSNCFAITLIIIHLFESKSNSLITKLSQCNPLLIASHSLDHCMLLLIPSASASRPMMGPQIQPRQLVLVAGLDVVVARKQRFHFHLKTRTPLTCPCQRILILIEPRHWPRLNWILLGLVVFDVATRTLLSGCHVVVAVVVVLSL